MGSAAALRRALRWRRLTLLALVGLLLCGQMYALACGVNYGLDLGPVWVSAGNFLRHRPIYAGEVETSTFSFLPPSGALLSFDVAAKVFLAVHILVLAVTTALFVRRFSGRNWLPALLGGAIGLALSQPFIYSLRFGSMNGLLVGAMLAFFVGAADDRRWTGPLLGVSLALKPVLWPLIVVLLLRRQHRQAATAVAVLAGLLLVATPSPATVPSTSPRCCPTWLEGSRASSDSTCRSSGSPSRPNGQGRGRPSGGWRWPALHWRSA